MPTSVGMSPTEMAQWLRDRFAASRSGARMAGRHAGDRQAVHGKISSSRAHSAADSRHRVGTGTTVFPFNRSYAEALARRSHHLAVGTLPPLQRQGHQRDRLVDELSGAITAIDKATNDAATKTMSDNSDVGAQPTAGTTARSVHR